MGAAANGPDVQVSARLAARSVDLNLGAPGGEVTALLGPNGAGKSTLLQLISGLVAPDEGRVSVGADVFVDTDRGVFRPPHARGLGVLTQNPLLFPHLSVEANVAFGPRCAGRGRAGS
ncbi:MAG: ATP-binding cassette domain-containing protein, partial [Micrococcales bacterium]|nr:ATP-binding cassette domain-containing protein [Micrococcales bacterium]